MLVNLRCKAAIFPKCHQPTTLSGSSAPRGRPGAAAELPRRRYPAPDEQSIGYIKRHTQPLSARLPETATVQPPSAVPLVGALATRGVQDPRRPCSSTLDAPGKTASPAYLCAPAGLAERSWATWAVNAPPWRAPRRYAPTLGAGEDRPGGIEGRPCGVDRDGGRTLRDHPQFGHNLRTNSSPA